MLETYTPTSGVREPRPLIAVCLDAPTAIESQAFSLKLPEHFFSLYSPPKTDSAFKASRERLEEGIKFMSKMVCPFRTSQRSLLTTNTKIANVCISLNEFPYIRYYMPSHHEPLGPLKPHEQTRPAPPPTDAASRWRTNLARGAQARAYEEADTDFCTKLLAFQVQGLLEEYKKQNPTFPVSESVQLAMRAQSQPICRSLIRVDHEGRCSSQTERWIL